MSDGVRRPAASFREQIADSARAADEIDRAQKCIRAAEPQPWLGDPPAFDAFHREGNRPPVLMVSSPSSSAPLGSPQDRVRIAHAAERAQRKQALVFNRTPVFPSE